MHESHQSPIKQAFDYARNDELPVFIAGDGITSSCNKQPFFCTEEIENVSISQGPFGSPMSSALGSNQKAQNCISRHSGFFGTERKELMLPFKDSSNLRSPSPKKPFNLDYSNSQTKGIQNTRKAVGHQPMPREKGLNMKLRLSDRKHDSAKHRNHGPSFGRNGFNISENAFDRLSEETGEDGNVLMLASSDACSLNSKHNVAVEATHAPSTNGSSRFLQQNNSSSLMLFSAGGFTSGINILSDKTAQRSLLREGCSSFDWDVTNGLSLTTGDRFFPIRPEDAPTEGAQLFQHEQNLMQDREQHLKERRARRQVKSRANGVPQQDDDNSSSSSSSSDSDNERSNSREKGQTKRNLKIYNSLLGQQCFAQQDDNYDHGAGSFTLQNLSAMNVLGTSELTTAPTTKSAIQSQKKLSETGMEVEQNNSKALKPHKRILKFNKKHRQKQFTSASAFRKNHLQENKPRLVNFDSENSPIHGGAVTDMSDSAQADGLKPARKVSKMPFKVLDAPQLQDDFYLNLVDWSSNNVLAVGLNKAVYVYSACTSVVSQLCEVGRDDQITSVAWHDRGIYLAVGTHQGQTQIWDTVKCKLVRTLSGHMGRVSSIAWNGSIVSTGSRDRNILCRDLRQDQQSFTRFQSHKQEVCGLKWSFDGQQLASGGNDNKLMIWNVHSNKPLVKFSDHTAAVKAIAWSPHQNGLLATGGGTADRHIRFWNTHTLQPLKALDTGSQVCNLVFSKTSNEIVSTHGYSLNQVVLWKYPTMQKLQTMVGHSSRVLYLSLSPDGQSIVTGAGDETLRFWNVFPSSNVNRGGVSGASALYPSSLDMR